MWRRPRAQVITLDGLFVLIIFGFSFYRSFDAYDLVVVTVIKKNIKFWNNCNGVETFEVNINRHTVNITQKQVQTNLKAVLIISNESGCGNKTTG